ncbi:MAG: ATP-binding protein [Lentisphaeria bacterium]|nr:ATP-binding protein [Lentisphaeria bacterium]
MDFNSTDWKELVYRGVESDELDYKAAQNWDEMTKAGRAKFVRHLLAFANTRGGFIVVGVGEDASGYPSKRTGLTPEQCASFDPSKVGSFVNQHVEPPIDFTIERPLIRCKRYAIFAIRPFKTLPHVCSSGVDGELQTGVFYIRTADASSRPARRALELSDIIRRALRNQREMLGRMLRGILYENRTDVSGKGRSPSFDDACASARAYFRRRRPADEETVHLAFFIEPELSSGSIFDTDELRQAVEQAGLPRPAGRFFTPELMKSIRPVNTGLRCLSEKEPCMWQLFNTGEFLFYADIRRNGKLIDAEEILKFAAECTAFCGKLYADLAAADDLLTVVLKLSSKENIKLKFCEKTVSKAAAAKSAASLCRSAADLTAGDGEHAAKLCAELAIPFRTSSKTAGETARFITEYLSEL